MLNFKRQSAALRAVGRIEVLKSDLRALRRRLEEVPLWLPGAGLGKQCEEALRMMDNISARFERNLVVAIIGPSGSGKSTLLNALVGVDRLSETGHRRPTTGELIVFARQRSDAEQLARDLGDERIDVRSSGDAEFPDSVCLIDTPDTDSAAFPQHRPLVSRAVAHADMLICVFDAENPKRRDHVDFLSPLVQRFDGESLIAVLNKCDRLDAAELQGEVLPDFKAYLQHAWQGAVTQVLSISARRHLDEPQWDADAGPKHDFDEFPRLRALVHDEINHAGYIVDRRLENVRSLHALVFEETGRELAADQADLQAAVRSLKDAGKEALDSAVAALQADEGRYLAGIGVMVYHRLSQRWMGPIGWLVAVWTRLLVLGAGVVSILRFGRPVHQLLGMVSSWRRLKESKRAVSEPEVAERVEAAVRSYRLSLTARWPAIAELLVRGRFEGSVRRLDDTMMDEVRVGRELAERWARAVDGEIERVARKLSGLVVQVVFNAPAVGILAYIGYVTVIKFFDGNYLTGDFFLHAFWVLAIVLLLSFFLLQVCIRMAGGSERLTARAFAGLKRGLDQVEGFVDTPARLQLAGVLQLAEIASLDKSAGAVA